MLLSGFDGCLSDGYNRSDVPPALAIWIFFSFSSNVKVPSEPITVLTVFTLNHFFRVRFALKPVAHSAPG